MIFIMNIKSKIKIISEDLILTGKQSVFNDFILCCTINRKRVSELASILILIISFLTNLRVEFFFRKNIRNSQNIVHLMSENYVSGIKYLLRAGFP